MGKWTIEKVREHVKENNPHGDRIVILRRNDKIEKDTKGYARRRRYYDCTCSLCKNEWNIREDSLVKRNQGCPKCKTKSKKDDLKFRIDNIKETYQLKLIDEHIAKYTDVKMNFIDNEGYKYFLSFKDIERKKTNKFFRFVSYNPHTINNIKKYIKIEEKQYSLVSNKYVYSDEKLDFICHVHNNGFKMTESSMQSGVGCPLCGSCYYNIHNAKENKDKWSKIESMVYVIELSNKDTNEKFYKIGIAKNGLKSRFVSNNMPYDYKPVRIIDKISQYEACFIESYLISMNIEYRYKPKLHFAGHTECFEKINKRTLLIKNEEILVREISPELEDFNNSIVDMYLSGMKMNEISKSVNLKPNTITRIVTYKNRIERGYLVTLNNNTLYFKSRYKVANHLDISDITLRKIIKTFGIKNIDKYLEVNKACFKKLKNVTIREVYIRILQNEEFKIIKIID